MGTFSFAQKIATDTRCAQGGMMDRAAVLVCHLEDFRAEVLQAERKRVLEAVRWFRNVERYTVEDVMARILDHDTSHT